MFRSLPLPGVVIAMVSCLGLLLLGTGVVEAGAILLVWLGSLWLVSATPPPARPVEAQSAIGREGMGNLVEHSNAPLLVIENDRVIIANLAARRLLGAHVVGQDARMALRQPEAVKLLDRDSDGAAVVRGLARRRDIWRVYRKTLDDGLAVIEFVNRTAEADISRAHTDFVANASHELRTPLAAIIGYVETLREDGMDGDAATRSRFLDIIAREAHRLQVLVDDLMSLSRIEAEKHELPRQTVDLTTLVGRAARDAAGDSRIERLSLAIAPDIGVRGDAQQLEQLVRNLVDNALKYGAEGETVEIALEPAGDDRAVLRVRDHGEGIPAEHLPHLTRRFYRTDPGRSRSIGGTGLGLAIVKHIVERHRGQLDISSKVGEGTTVSVHLPRRALDAAED